MTKNYRFFESTKIDLNTADFIQQVLGVYTRSMETIYLSLRAQVAVGTFFMIYPVVSFILDFLYCLRFSIRRNVSNFVDYLQTI